MAAAVAAVHGRLGGGVYTGTAADSAVINTQMDPRKDNRYQINPYLNLTTHIGDAVAAGTITLPTLDDATKRAMGVRPTTASVPAAAAADAAALAEADTHIGIAQAGPVTR